MRRIGQQAQNHDPGVGVQPVQQLRAVGFFQFAEQSATRSAETPARRAAAVWHGSSETISGPESRIG